MVVKPFFLTYFRVTYDEKTFSFEDFCEQLGLDLQETKDYGATDNIYIGYHYATTEDLNEMVRTSLKDLFGKEEILAKLKEKYNLKYTLERVPTVSNNYRLNLSLANDIIAFLYKTGSSDNLDYFVD